MKQPIPWTRLIAESIAIVGSILLAFAIDAWWDKLQDTAEERRILVGLSDEFGPVLSATLDDGQGVELYYDIAISERCRFALDLQVVEPNFVGVDTALVPGIRSHVEF